MRGRLRRRIRDGETCCVQPGVVSFQPDTGEQIRAPPPPPRTLLLERACVRVCCCARACACPRPRPCLCTRTGSDRLSTSRGALQCSQAPITVGHVPFSSVLEVMWLALQGRHHHYTHISAEILPAPAALHHNPTEMIIMTSAHSRGKR